MFTIEEYDSLKPSTNFDCKDDKEIELNRLEFLKKINVDSIANISDEEKRQIIILSAKFVLPPQTLGSWTSQIVTSEANRVLSIFNSRLVTEELVYTLKETLKNLPKNQRNLHKELPVLPKLLGYITDDSEIDAINLGLLYSLVSIPNSIDSNWSIILPTLLAFFDSVDFLKKREASLILSYICESSQSNIIKRTQTEPLFSESILPLLLPTLNKPEITIKTLPIGYSTMIKLLDGIYLQSDLDKESENFKSNQLKYYLRLSALLNDHLISGLQVQNINLLTTVINIISDILSHLGPFGKVVSRQIIWEVLNLLMDPYISDTIMDNCIDLVIQCTSAMGESAKKLKFDILGCSGVLKRRERNGGERLESLGTVL